MELGAKKKMFDSICLYLLYTRWFGLQITVMTKSIKKVYYFYHWDGGVIGVIKSGAQHHPQGPKCFVSFWRLFSGMGFCLHTVPLCYQWAPKIPGSYAHACQKGPPSCITFKKRGKLPRIPEQMPLRLHWSELCLGFLPKHISQCEQKDYN